MNEEALYPNNCPAVKTVAEMDPELDAIGRRCTGGVPWSTVPIGVDSMGIVKDVQFDYPIPFDPLSNFKYVMRPGVWFRQQSVDTV